MNGELEDVAFIARSENRLEILQLLAAEPRNRTDLQDRTGASRVTVGRILAELDQRGWIVPTGDEFRVTAVGRGVANELRDLQETLEAADVLGPIGPALPPDFLTIDVRHFRDAELITASESDPLAVARIAADLMDEADHVQVLASAVTSDTVDAQIRAARDAAQVSEIVLTTETVRAIRENDQLADRVRTALALDGVSIFETAADLPVSMGIYDGTTVALGVIGSSAMPTATLLSRDATVRSWARDTFERYCADARELRPADVSE